MSTNCSSMRPPTLAARSQGLALHRHRARRRPPCSPSCSHGDTSPMDVGEALDREGIAVRAGRRCAPADPSAASVTKATVRPSLALYNTRDDVDALVAALLRLQNGRSYGL